jgi:uncharacterized protein (UPF0335 family)
MAAGDYAQARKWEKCLMSEATHVDAPEKPVVTGGVSADRLHSIVDRIERLEAERAAISGDVKDIYAEAKSAGFDVKVLRQIIRIRKLEPADVEEQETLLDVYRNALGMRSCRHSTATATARHTTPRCWAI